MTAQPFIRNWTRVLWTLAAALCLACASSGPNTDTRPAAKLLAQGKITEAQAEYERLKQIAPDQEDIRVGLGYVHFELAKQALTAKDEEKYTAELQLAQDEALRAIDLAPESHRGHVVLGIISAYRGDLRAAQESFELARRLDPLQPVHYLNLAELNIYRGRVGLARRYIAKARKRNASPADVEMVEVLAAWRDKDYVEAKDIFEDVALLDPEVAANWNGGQGIKTFDDMTKFCCETIACGPYMKAACKDVQQQVAERTLKEETVRKEIAMELERQRRSKQTRDRLRALQIEVDDLDSGPGATDQETEPADPNAPRRTGEPRPPKRSSTPSSTKSR